LANLRELEKQHGWDRLEEIGAQFEAGMREALAKAGKNFTFHRVGSMFCLFFREGEVRDLDSAMAVDKESFGKFFHACLERGVYFAPSPYETGFLCLAHAADDIGQTLDVVGEALAVC
jgi:glutamate-1-semialdehyde 2,1-aminomutase